MLDSTLNYKPNWVDRSHSFTAEFPTFNEHISPNKLNEPVKDGTTYVPTRTISANTETRLFDELEIAYLHAKSMYQDLNSTKFVIGYHEAKILIYNRLFSEELYPTISIDPYGEFIFTHKSNKGYVDIGVRGENELSYHVRNDVNPSETRYDDYEWDDNYIIPKALYNALNSLKQQF